MIKFEVRGVGVCNVPTTPRYRSKCYLNKMYERLILYVYFILLYVEPLRGVYDKGALNIGSLSDRGMKILTCKKKLQSSIFCFSSNFDLEDVMC